MALELNLATSPLGIALPSAYARVVNVHADKSRVRVLVAIHATAAARQSNSQPVDQNVHNLKLSDIKGDLFPALYGALKALPEYSGAKDA